MTSVIHIRSTFDTEDKIISELMNILIKHGYKTEKYVSVSHKIVMSKKIEVSK